MGKKGARDFSFLVTEDEQEEGPNVNFLDDGDDSDSDDSGGSGDEGGEGGGEGGDDGGGGATASVATYKATDAMGLPPATLAARTAELKLACLPGRLRPGLSCPGWCGTGPRR